MSGLKPPFVLVHGAWHSHAAWNRVASILEAQGFATWSPDLPGAGIGTIAPTSLSHRPFELAAFAAERSPIAGVTQEERTAAAVASVKEAAALCAGKVVLVGHSAGGLTVSAVAERVPELLRA